MLGFLTFVLLTYSGIHLLVCLRFRAFIPDNRWLRLAALLFLLTMIAAPVGSRLLEQAGSVFWGRVAAWIGFVWMGFVLIAFFVSVGMYLLEGLIQLLGLFLNPVLKMPSPMVWSVASLLLSLAFFSYGLFEANSLRVERITIASAKLPPSETKLRIVQISDLHLGGALSLSRTRRVVEAVKGEKPDLVAATGDIIDGRNIPLAELTELFRSIRPRLGKYAVFGNHEVYVGPTWSKKCLEDFGFTLLRNRIVTLDGFLALAGVDDPQVGGEGGLPARLAELDGSLFRLLLKHRPEVAPEDNPPFDLQLSGHTHRGQIFPFNFITGAVYPLQDGLYRLKNGSFLYTSRGSGSWGPPVRLLSPPEITVIEIVRED